MFHSGSIRLARVLGIRIGVDPSWFVVLFFFIYLLSGAFRDVLGDGRETAAFLTAVASALLFFASLVLHELGHALVARRLGIEIVGIDLWFFGGIAKMSRETDSARDEFKVAVAGPLVTLALTGLCVGVGILIDGSQRFWDALTLTPGSHASPALLLLSWLATINAAVLLFNLVPAFPLDGGRIARAIAWARTGDRLRATRFAAAIGRGFSYLLIALGIFVAIDVGAWLSGLWLIVLGLFLGQAARGAVAQTAFSERLSQVTVADIMDRELVAVPAALSATEAHETYFLRYRWPWFPVVDAAGRYVGLIDEHRVEDETAGGGERRVEQLMDPDDGKVSVGEDTGLDALIGSEALRRSGVLLAVDAAGVLRGIVTLEQVRRALQAAVVPEGGHASAP